MSIPKLEFLLVKADLLGSLASVALALRENTDRRLVQSTGYGSGLNQEVGSRKPLIGAITNARKMQTLTPNSIALYLNQKPKDITRGFIFGSDPVSCDVLLASTNDMGISAKHFSIHIDWDSRDPTITCLSGNPIRIRAIGAESKTLVKNKWQRLPPGSTTIVRITQSLHVELLSPHRGNHQAAYLRNLQDYILDFQHAVPELATISLRDTEVTPLIVYRCPGLKGNEYYTTGRIKTGDQYYDSTVLLYNAMCKPQPDAPVTIQGSVEFNLEQSNHSSYASGKRPITPWKIRRKLRCPGYPDTEDWVFDDSTGRQPRELFIVKHYRDKKTQTTLPSRFKELCDLDHVRLLHPGYFTVSLISNTS